MCFIKHVLVNRLLPRNSEKYLSQIKSVFNKMDIRKRVKLYYLLSLKLYYLLKIQEKTSSGDVISNDNICSRSIRKFRSLSQKSHGLLNKMNSSFPKKYLLTICRTTWIPRYTSNHCGSIWIFSHSKYKFNIKGKED